MSITVHTQDFEFAKELAQSAPAGVSASIAKRGSKSIGGDPYGLVIVTLEFVGAFAFAVDASLFAIWLHSKTNERNCEIKHRGKAIPKDQEVIRRLVDQEIEIGKND